LSGTDIRRGTLLATGAATWAAAFLIFYKQASVLADASVVALALLAVAAVLNTAAAVVETRGKLRVDRVSAVTAVALAVFSVTGNLCGSKALATLDPGIMAVLLRTQVVFVALAGLVFLRERVTAALAVGALIALAGLVLMRMPLGAAADLAGIAWALGAAASFAAMAVVTRKVIHRIQPVAVNAVRLWLAVGLLAALPGTAAGAAHAGGELWLMAAGAAFCGPFASRLFIMYALRHVTAAYQALVNLSSPVLAFVLAFLVLGTVPSGHELAGGAVMLVGIAVPVIAGLRAARASAP
jgi:drug/metabolite transporter (DMT)-like permease